MILASYLLFGRESFGLVKEGGVVDLGGRLPYCPDLPSFIAHSAASSDGLAMVESEPDVELSSVRLLPPIPRPGKIICIGLNYAPHASEAGLKTPVVPRFFVRVPDSLVASGGQLIRPLASTQFDYEGELAVIVGKRGRYIRPDDGFQHVFGYSCFNDGSLRDIQTTDSVSAGKNFYATGGFGPWIVTSDAIPNPTNMELKTRVNGEEVQRAKIDDLIFSIPELLSHLSSIMPLNPGDVIVTGTPSGVGFAQNPQLWLKPGDEVEVEISEIGILRNSVASDEGLAM